MIICIYGGTVMPKFVCEYLYGGLTDQSGTAFNYLVWLEKEI